MSLTAKKTVGVPFSNDFDIIRVEYDFANDGGAAGDYDVLELADDAMVELVSCNVETAATSGGAAVLDLGVGDGGTELWSDQGYANLAAGAVVLPDAFGAIKVADGEKIVLGIETAALTAGKFEFVFKIYRF